MNRRCIIAVAKRFAAGFTLAFTLLLAACQVRVPVSPPTLTATNNAPSPEPTMIPIPDENTVAGFEYFLERALESDRRDRQQMVNAYLAQFETAPLISGTGVVFLYQGAANTVALYGDMNGWDRDGLPLARLDGTDLWYLSTKYESDARLDYRILVDGTPQLDPLNPRTILSGSGPNSELIMPAYPDLPGPAASVQDLPAGEITSHIIESAALGQRRTIYVYMPPGQVVGEQLPAVYFNDGGDYLNLGEAAEILDRLIAAREVQPLVAVFIPPISRLDEYRFDDRYVTFLADEVVPFVRVTYHTETSPERTATVGASMGGLMALYSAFSRPDVFGLAAGQSGIYSLDNDFLLQEFRANARIEGPGTSSIRNLRIFLVAGTYEGRLELLGGEHDPLAAQQRLVPILLDSVAEVRALEKHEGHSWGLWRGTLDEALAFLLD